jgi:microcystin-dependent protein
MSDPFLGEIRMVGFTFAPYGWALCQGQTVPVTQNQALFAMLGTTYGGNGTTNFNLPDLQGRSPVGTGNGLNLTPIEPGDEGGQENFTLTLNQLPSHTHVASSAGGVTVSGTVSIPANNETTGTSNTPSSTTVLGAPTYSGHDVSLYSSNTANTSLAPINVSLQGSAPAIQNSSTGNSLPTPLRNPYLGLTCIIALQGVYPTRG